MRLHEPKQALRLWTDHDREFNQQFQYSDSIYRFRFQVRVCEFESPAKMHGSREFMLNAYGCIQLVELSVFTCLSSG